MFVGHGIDSNVRRVRGDGARRKVRDGQGRYKRNDWSGVQRCGRRSRRGGGKRIMKPRDMDRLVARKNDLRSGGEGRPSSGIEEEDALFYIPHPVASFPSVRLKLPFPLLKFPPSHEECQGEAIVAEGAQKAVEGTVRLFIDSQVIKRSFAQGEMVPVVWKSASERNRRDLSGQKTTETIHESDVDGVDLYVLALTRDFTSLALDNAVVLSVADEETEVVVVE